MKEKINGWWVNNKDKPLGTCDLCGAKIIIVPKEGHLNSEFWRLQKTEKEALVCCSKGCLEKKE